MPKNKFLTIYCIYNANGSLSGEIAYFFKKYFYGLKCSMCEITHNFISEKEDWKDRLSQTKINLKTVHLDEQNNDLYQFSFGNTPCVVGENEKGFKFIFSNTDLDNFNGDVKLFFKSLENKINKIF